MFRCDDGTSGKEHNDANIIAFGARIVGVELAKDIVKAYLNAEFLVDVMRHAWLCLQTSKNGTNKILEKYSIL